MTLEPPPTTKPEADDTLPADADEFGRLLDTFRRDIVVLGYRFLGSVSDAEDAAQETFLRAWRARAGYRGEAGLRTWLHRIATRVCLDALEHRGRRQMPYRVGGPSDSSQPPAAPTTEILWLEPLPDSYLVDASLDPAARYSLRESVALAFTAALQTLPTRQRAVLLLRDVLSWHSSEVAEVLERTVPAVNSALNRARATLGATEREPYLRVVRPAEATHADLLETYMRAWETDDVDALVGILRKEVRLAMPPSPAWYEGRGAVIELIHRWVEPRGPFKLYLTGANMQPAAVLCNVAEDGGLVPLSVHVLSVRDGRIDTINAFVDERIAAWFVEST